MSRKSIWLAVGLVCAVAVAARWLTRGTGGDGGNSRSAGENGRKIDGGSPAAYQVSITAERMSTEEVEASVIAPVAEQLAAANARVQWRVADGGATLWVESSASQEELRQRVAGALREAGCAYSIEPALRGKVLLLPLRMPGSYDPRVVLRGARAIESGLAGMEGVAAVGVIGPEPRYRITVEPVRLAAQGLVVPELARRIRTALSKSPKEADSATIIERLRGVKIDELVAVRDVALVDLGYHVPGVSLEPVAVLVELDAAASAEQVNRIREAAAELARGGGVELDAKDDALPARQVIDRVAPTDTVRWEGKSWLWHIGPADSVLIIQHDDAEKLDRVIGQVGARSADIGGGMSASLLLESNVPQINVDLERAKALGVESQDAEETLICATGGLILEQVGEGQESCAVVMGVAEHARDEWETLQVRDRHGVLVPLKMVMDLRHEVRRQFRYGWGRQRAGFVRFTGTGDVARVDELSRLAEQAGAKVERWSSR